MKKLSVILILVAMSLAFGSLAQARPPGKWVEFTTVRGENVGEPDILKVYYDTQTLKVIGNHISVHLWQEGRGWFEYIMLENTSSGWVYYHESNRVPLRAGGTAIQPRPVPKGSVFHQLLKTLSKKGLLKHNKVL